MSERSDPRGAGEVAFPLALDAQGRTATLGRAPHVTDMVEAVLFTAPGERVNRPDFGCGLDLLLFAPVDQAVVATAEVQVRSSLQRWLNAVIEVDDVAVSLDEAAFTVAVSYRLRDTGESRTDTFERGT